MSNIPPEHSGVAREIHHRVKNNLQIIASILRLQMRREESPAAQAALAGAVQRLLGMVQVHDLLARVDAQSVNLNDLLRRIVELNVQAFLLPGQVILHEVRGPDISLGPDRALSVALAANELVINALKHAYSGRREGRIEISIEPEPEALTIRVRDDGVGLAEGFSLIGSANLGLKLVRSVVESDLKGEFSLTSEPPGTTAKIRFPR